jgi:RNA polymerase sigma-70 factor (ECF subfamily)
LPPGGVFQIERGRLRGIPVTEPEDIMVEQAKSDPAAFGRLYQRYVDRIYNYIFHRTGNHYDAEDLTARTFYKALTSIAGYTDRGVPFSAWLYRIAHNLVANWHRDQDRRQFVALDELLISSPRHSPDHAAERQEEERALAEAIRDLAPDRQMLLILKFSEGLSNAEIGRVLGRSEGAIKSLYHRTLVVLREHMQGRGFLDDDSMDHG